MKYDSKFFSIVAFITSIAIKEPMAPTNGEAIADSLHDKSSFSRSSNKHS